MHQEWMGDVAILPRSLGNSSWSWVQNRGVIVTPPCDWLREVQDDHEADWPSAYTTLKALSKVAPAELRRLHPVMHEVTRRIMNHPVISKAAESERLMAPEVAEDLGVRIIEAVTASLRTTTQLWRSWAALHMALASATHSVRYIATLRNPAQVALVPMAQALSLSSTHVGFFVVVGMDS